MAARYGAFDRQKDVFPNTGSARRRYVTPRLVLVAGVLVMQRRAQTKQCFMVRRPANCTLLALCDLQQWLPAVCEPH